MSTFDEYAALARRLAAHRREQDRDIAAEADRRRALHAALDQLTRRLAAQHHRLDQLGRALRLPPPPAPSTASPAGPARPIDPSAEPAGPDAPAGPAGDPAAVLAETHRLVAEADRLVALTEAVASRPPLLPSWSPLARALIVYVGCVLTGIVAALALVVGSDLAAGLGTLHAAMCAGLPVLTFLAGYLVLGRWGRPALGDEAPPRFVPLGFVLCALLIPFAYCADLLLLRLLR